MFVLISVCDRDITTTKHCSFKAARAEMVKELRKTGVKDMPELHDMMSHDYEDFAIHRDSAWSNEGNTNNDWLIVEV